MSTVVLKKHAFPLGRGPSDPPAQPRRPPPRGSQGLREKHAFWASAARQEPPRWPVHADGAPVRFRDLDAVLQAAQAAAACGRLLAEWHQPGMAEKHEHIRRGGTVQ